MKQLLFNDIENAISELRNNTKFSLSSLFVVKKSDPSYKEITEIFYDLSDYKLMLLKFVRLY